MPWDQWVKYRADNKALNDNRFTSARTRLQDEDHDKEISGTELRPTFDRAYRVTKLYCKTFGIADMSGKDLDNMDEVPASIYERFDVPDGKLQLKMGERVKGFESICPGVLIQRKDASSGTGLRFVFTTSAGRGVSEKRGSTLVCSELAEPTDATHYYRAHRELDSTISLSDWLLHPVKKTANAKYFKFLVNPSAEMFWHRRGCLALKADPTQWTEHQGPGGLQCRAGRSHARAGPRCRAATAQQPGRPLAGHQG